MNQNFILIFVVCLLAFKAHIQFGRLSQRAKQLFSKDPELRTENNIDELYRVVDKLQCFSKYSRAEKPGLAKFVYYSQYETGRIIVKQGIYLRNL